MKGRHHLKFLAEITFYGVTSAFLFATIIGAVLAPAPLLYMYARYGKIASLVCLLLASLTILIIMRDANTLLIFGTTLGTLLLGLFYFLDKKNTTPNIIFKCSAIMLCLCGIFLFSKTGFDYTRTQHGVSKYIEQTQKTLSQQPALSEKFEKNIKLSRLWHSPETLAANFLEQLPGYIITFILLLTWLNIIFLRKWAPHLFLQTEKLHLWKAPELLVWAAIACLVPIVFGEVRVINLATNILRILLFIYFLQGLAILSFLFHNRKITLPMQFLLLLFMSIINIPLPSGEGIFSSLWVNLPTLIGFFDIWINFRGRLSPPKRSYL